MDSNELYTLGSVQTFAESRKFTHVVMIRQSSISCYTYWIIYSVLIWTGNKQTLQENTVSWHIRIEMVEYIQPLRFQFMHFMQTALKNDDISQYAYRV
jgi:hypothetical protein